MKGKKQTKEQLRQLLQQNTPPTPENEKRQLLISRLTADAADMDYLKPESFMEKIMIAGSYFSPWTWITHAFLLGLFLCNNWLENMTQTYSYLLCLAPGLTMILLSELSKTFGHNMWEMENACRYDLPRLFFMRLTLLSGLDFLFLTVCFVAFRRMGGLFWEFALYALFPYFLLSALCLLLLRHFGSRCNRMALSAIVILVEVLWVPLAEMFGRLQLHYGTDLTEKVVLYITLTALLLYLGSAVALCTKKYYGNSGRRKIIWN